MVGGRGLSIGRVFAEDGRHVATVAQEALCRPPRQNVTRCQRQPHVVSAHARSRNDQLGTRGRPIFPTRHPGPGQVLAKVLACGICGSDLHLLKHGEEARRLSDELDAGRAAGPDPRGALRALTKGS